MQVREYIPAGCATAGVIHQRGEMISGEVITRSIASMRERSNGLGGGFAGYGIYADMKELYAIHLMYDDKAAQRETEDFLSNGVLVVRSELIPTQPTPRLGPPPLLWRYFVQPPQSAPRLIDETEDDYIVRIVMHINLRIDGAYVVSSGKNIGVFKGVGYPEEIAHFFRISQYQAYMWIAHARFPTNTQAWWGGAHPFNILNWSVVHNGELSSYGINKRYLEQFGYHCTLKTDTEVLVYLLDLFIRRQKLPMRIVHAILAPPFWEQIARMRDAEKRAAYTALRQVYGGGLANGPFSIIIGYERGMIGLTDRIKLRPLVIGRGEGMIMMASEEAAIREVCAEPKEIWEPRAGFPIIAELDSEVIA